MIQDDPTFSATLQFLCSCIQLQNMPVVLKHVSGLWHRKPSSNSKPHKSNDMGWEAIQALRARDGAVGLSHFKLLRRLGCGDIGSVYLCELRGTDCYFAMKVAEPRHLLLVFFLFGFAPQCKQLWCILNVGAHQCWSGVVVFLI